MRLRDLPNDSHVARYVKPSHYREDGTIDGECFRLRLGETAVSVNWLESFPAKSRKTQLREIRRVIRLTLRPNGRFAELNTSNTIKSLDSRLPDIRFVHSPRDATSRHDADPSHSEIVGLPLTDSAESLLIGEMIAECVGQIYPAVE